MTWPALADKMAPYLTSEGYQHNYQSNRLRAPKHKLEMSLFTSFSRRSTRDPVQEEKDRAVEGIDDPIDIAVSH